MGMGRSVGHWFLVLTAVALAGCADEGGGGSEDCSADQTFDGNECIFPGEPGPTGFPQQDNSSDEGMGFGLCNPRQADPCHDFSSGVDARDTGLICCSDDPAAPGGALPDFAGRGIGGGAAPLFAGANNALGTSGMCIHAKNVEDPLTETAAAGCPVPCNPTWSDEDVGAVCGGGAVCCQTRLLDPLDCVMGEDGNLRPVTGDDIGELTDWNPGAHRTHQDPAGIGCSGLAQGDMDSEVFRECIRELTVADQRGFCVQADACPTLEQPC